MCVWRVCACLLEICQGACQPARLSSRAPAGGGGFRRAPCLRRPTGACWEKVGEEAEGAGGERRSGGWDLEEKKNREGE